MNAPNCQKFSEQLSLYLANELPDAAREDIRAHLETCTACREELESLRLLNGAMAMSPLPEKLDAKRIAAIVAKHRAVTSAPKKKPIRFPKLSPATLIWLAPLARAAIFILLPGALLLGLLMPASMKARRGQYALISGRPLAVQGVSALNGDDTYVHGILREAQKESAAARTESESRASPVSGKSGKDDQVRWYESDGLERGKLAENKPVEKSPAIVLGNPKSEISNLESPAPVQPATPAITLASAVPPPPPAPVNRSIGGVVGDLQRRNLGEISGVTPNYYAYTAGPEPAQKADGKKEERSSQDGGVIAGSGALANNWDVGRAATPGANVAAQDRTMARGRGVNASGPTLLALTAESDANAVDQNGRVDMAYGIAAVPASKPAAPGWQFQAAQADRPVVVNGLVSDLTIKDLSKTGGGTLTLDGANTYAGVTTVSGGALVAPPSGGIGGYGVIVANASAAKPADVTEFEIAARDTAAQGATRSGFGRSFMSGKAEPAKESGGVTLIDETRAKNDLFFDLAGQANEAAKTAADKKSKPSGPAGWYLGWGETAGERAGGRADGTVAKSRELASAGEVPGLTAGRESHDFSIIAGKEVALGDTDGDGRDKDVSKRLEVDSFAVNKSDFEGEKRADAGDRLVVPGDLRSDALAAVRSKLKGGGGGGGFIGMVGAAPAEPAQKQTEKLKTDYPKPMFVGTPVPTKLPNLEPPAAGPVSTRAYTVPNEAMAKFKGGNGYEGLTKQLEEKGIKTPAGSKATYDAETEQLVVTSTPEGLSRLDETVASLKKIDGQKPVPAAEPARPAPPRVPAGFNPYIDSKDDAFSTFSIDVDTASYTLTRRAIEEGRLPDPEQVRTEEIVNAFDYDYATPANGAFAMHAEFAPSPFRAPLELLKVGIRGRVLGRDAKKPAVLTLVIDTSGSMDTADRLGRIRPALRMLVDQLKPNDTVAIVAFNNDARLLLDRTRGENKQAILAAIDSIIANGSTQLEGGMKLAYEVAARGFISGGANRVVLMSDGVANLGAATAQEILASVDQYRKQGIYLTVLGFGSGNYDDAMLMQLADKGDGAYSFVDSDEEAKRLLVDQWEQTLNVIAKDVKIQIEFNPERVKLWRQIGYEKRHLTKQDFRNDAVDAGEVGSGQSVTALYDIELARSGDIPVSDFGHRNVSDTTIATLRVRYKDPDTGKVTELEQRITDANRHANFASAPVRFRAAACAAEFAELLRVSPYTAGSDFAAVIEQLRPVAASLTLDQRVQELLRMAERARGLAK